jgi:hypothetical protein
VSKAFVYFIRCEDTDLVKVGWATNVRMRRKSLQIGCPYRLRVHAEFEFPSADEAKRIEAGLHAALRSSHVRGEWYRFEKETLAELLSLAEKRDPARYEVAF